MSEPTTDGEYEIIYLTPHCKKCVKELSCSYEGMSWCSDPQEPCDECGKEWVEYRRASAVLAETGGGDE